MMDRVVGYVESVLVLLTWCLLQQVFNANREFTSLEKIHFFSVWNSFCAFGRFCTF